MVVMMRKKVPRAAQGHWGSARPEQGLQGVASNEGPREGRPLGKLGLLSAVTSRRGTGAGVWQGECGQYGESHSPAWGLLSHRTLAGPPGNGEVRAVSRGGPDRPNQGWKNPLVRAAWGMGSAGPRPGHLYSHSPRSQAFPAQIPGSAEASLLVWPFHGSLESPE